MPWSPAVVRHRSGGVKPPSTVSSRDREAAESYCDRHIDEYTSVEVCQQLVEDGEVDPFEDVEPDPGDVEPDPDAAASYP